MMNYTPAELLNIGRRQRNVLWLLLGTLLFYVLMAVVPTRGLPLGTPEILILGTLAIVILSVTFIYQMASALKSDMAWLYAILGLVGVVQLIVLLVLNSKATSALRKNGIAVGFMGANVSELAKLAAGGTPDLASPTPLKEVAQSQSLMEELRGLAKLRDEGLITEQEFTQKKKMLMGL